MSRRTKVLIFVYFLLQIGICYADEKPFLFAETPTIVESPSKQSIPHIRLNYWQIMGKVKGTKEFFTSCPKGKTIAFDVVLPQRSLTEADKKTLLEFIRSGEIDEHAKDIEDRKIPMKWLAYLFELTSLDQGDTTKHEESPLEVRIKPLWSIKKGSLTFFNQHGSITFLPDNHLISFPGGDLPKRTLKFFSELGASFSVYNDEFRLLLNDARPLSDASRSYMDYCVFPFPVRKEGEEYLARIRMKLSEDFEGDRGYWEYITYAFMF